MALSTMNSSAKRMWQKFFLLFRIAVMSPHCSKTSWMISSVAFSGNPPTKTVLHPGGRSLVEGGGRSENHNKTQDVLPFTYFCSIFFFFLFSGSPGKSHTRRLTFSILSDDERLERRTRMGVSCFQCLPHSHLSTLLCSSLRSGYARPWTEIKQMWA